jgi:DNA-binding NarL/FixJ family response regulator
VRDTPVGALNAYCRPDHDPDEGEVAFLASMADHAAVAVENARLLAESSGKAALEERHRLARDLHDSACQQLFSLALHVRAAQLTLPRQGPENETVRRSLQTLDQLAHATLDDMRGLLFELRPPVLHERCAGAGGTVTPGAAPRIRVFVVDDHAVVRLGLRTFLDAVSDVELIGEATGGHAALERLDRLAELGKLPHVVLMDLVMRDPDGVATTEMILERHPKVAVVVVTGFGEVHRVQAALEAGATGHVLKDADVDEIVHAIRAAYRGEVHLDDTVTRTLTQALAGTRRGADALTRRERDVLVLVAQGRSNREIARILSIGERTVQTHLSNVLGKLELSSRTQAALWAVREGLVGL